jgi:hypothetical protein
MCYRDSTAQRPRQTLEVADIFRAYGDAYRATHTLAGQQLRVMRAIEQVPDPRPRRAPAAVRPLRRV